MAASEDELDEACARAACVAAYEDPNDRIPVRGGTMARWRCYLLLVRRVRAIMKTAAADDVREAA